MYACLAGAAPQAGDAAPGEGQADAGARRPGRASIPTSCSTSSTGACGSTTWSARRACSRCRRRCSARRSPGIRSEAPSLFDQLKNAIGCRSCSGRVAGHEIHHLPGQPRRRAHGNQDRVGYWRTAATRCCMVVADGMGGHLHGEVAAQIAVPMLTQRVPAGGASRSSRDPDEFLVPRDQPRARARSCAHAETRRACRMRRARRCVACVVQDGYAYWAHVGDSRLYVFREGRILARTRDHYAGAAADRRGPHPRGSGGAPPRAQQALQCLGGVAAAAHRPSAQRAPARRTTSCCCAPTASGGRSRSASMLHRCSRKQTR